MFKSFSAIFVTFLLAISNTALMAQESTSTFSNESEAGLVVTSGNSETQTYNLQQSNKYSLGNNSLALKAKYLQQKSAGVLSAKPWSVGLRYERVLNHKFSLFAGELLESDIFAKYQQRYHSDLGAKYIFSSNESLKWFYELGYRFTMENRTNGEELEFHYMRNYTEVEKFWNSKVSSKLWLEYLTNFTTGTDYQMNAEFSSIAQLQSIFSIKVGYLFRYDNLPAPGASTKSDSTFTTSLVAKF